MDAGALSVGGFTIVTNVSQQIGTPGTPHLNPAFSAVTSDSATHTLFLYASATGFTGQGAFSFTLGGNQNPAGAGDSIIAKAWGGTSNTNLDLRNLLSSLSSSASPFAVSSAGSLNPTVNPYALTIGVQITRNAAGTTGGGANFAVVPNAVPEPATMLLMGVGLAGLAGTSRRRRQAGVVRPISS